MRSLQSFMKMAVTVGAMFLIGGCASVRGFPNPSMPPSTARAEVAGQLTKAATDACVTTTATTVCRNSLIDARLRAINIEFEEYERALYREGIGTGIGTDWVAIALNSIGAVTSASKPLSAAAAGVLGGRASYEKQALHNLTLPVMLAQMTAKRKEVLVRIRAGEKKDLAQYSVYRALDDVDDYALAGTIPGAVAEMVANAGAQAKEAKAALDQIDLVVPVAADIQKRREIAAGKIKSATDSQLALFLRLSAVTPSSVALVDGLNIVDRARSSQEIDAVCLRLVAAIGGEGC